MKQVFRAEPTVAIMGNILLLEDINKRFHTRSGQVGVKD